MPEMKDSGIEWIGMMPKHWELIRIKNTSWLKGRIGWQGLRSDEFLEDGPFLITGTDFQNGYVNWDTCVHISEKRFMEDPLLHIKEGDLLITKDGTIGKVAIVKNCPSKTSLNSGVMIIRNKGIYQYFDKYMYYLLLSEQFTKWFKLTDIGNSTIKHLTQDKFYKFKFTYPSLDEQIKIANFLDQKCSEIDALTADIQSQIDILEEYKKSVITEAVTKGLNPDVEMKDSGVELVGLIPNHWTILKTGYLFKENVRKADKEDMPLSLSQVDGLIATNDMKESSLKTSSYDGWKHVIKGDLVLNRFKAHLGVMFASTLEGMVSFHYGVFERQRLLVPKYYEYLYHTSPYKTIYAGLSNGMTVGLQNLSNFNFYSAKSLYPPYIEQQEIVEYLDDKCAEVDEVIADKKAQLETLAEYKKSLIYEYVTGKKEVPADV